MAAARSGRAAWSRQYRRPSSTRSSTPQRRRKSAWVSRRSAGGSWSQATSVVMSRSTPARPAGHCPGDAPGRCAASRPDRPVRRWSGPRSRSPPGGPVFGPLRTPRTRRVGTLVRSTGARRGPDRREVEGSADRRHGRSAGSAARPRRTHVQLGQRTVVGSLDDTEGEVVEQFVGDDDRTAQVPRPVRRPHRRAPDSRPGRRRPGDPPAAGCRCRPRPGPARRYEQHLGAGDEVARPVRPHRARRRRSRTRGVQASMPSNRSLTRHRPRPGRQHRPVLAGSADLGAGQEVATTPTAGRPGGWRI